MRIGNVKIKWGKILLLLTEYGSCNTSSKHLSACAGTGDPCLVYGQFFPEIFKRPLSFANLAKLKG
jgi:hypothetical protein